MSISKEDLLDLNIIQSLIELGGDDGDEFFKEIIDLYKEQYPILLQQIKNYLSNEDYVNLSKSAHALKGASLNIGAKEIASICKIIEINSKTDTQSPCDAPQYYLRDLHCQPQRIGHGPLQSSPSTSRWQDAHRAVDPFPLHGRSPDSVSNPFHPAPP